MMASVEVGKYLPMNTPSEPTSFMSQKDYAVKFVLETIKLLLSCKIENLEEEFYKLFRRAAKHLSIFAPVENYEEELEDEINKCEVFRREVPTELGETFDLLVEAYVTVLSKLAEMGEAEFRRIVEERASKEYQEFLACYYLTYYLFIACLYAKKGFVEYKEEVLTKLMEWLNFYREELDAYTSTIDLLLTDKYYEVLKNYLPS